jgi:uncharacterized protein YcgI (DUF1989 family)
MAQTANVSATTRRMIADDLIPARQGGAWLVNRGQHIRVIDVEGGQICDFVCFNADKLAERFSQARTKANQGKFTITTGDHLYSRDNNVMLTIVEDTYRDHDLQWGMCSAWVFENVRRKYHGMAETFSVGGPLGSPPFGCYEVLQKALKPWAISPENIPDPFNIFQTMDIQMAQRRLAIVNGRSKPGDYVDMVATMDTLCAASACPSTGRPLRVQVYES